MHANCSSFIRSSSLVLISLYRNLKCIYLDEGFCYHGLWRNHGLRVGNTLTKAVEFRTQSHVVSSRRYNTKDCGSYPESNFFLNAYLSHDLSFSELVTRFVVLSKWSDTHAFIFFRSSFETKSVY